MTFLKIIADASSLLMSGTHILDLNTSGNEIWGLPLITYAPRGGQVSYTFLLRIHCPKLRVHPALSVHISTTGCTILGGVHPVCARFLSHLLLLYIGRVHEANSGCTVL